MRLPWPKTLYGLLLVGFALVALPLLIALISSALEMNRLARQSEALVLQGVEVTRLTRALTEEITSMERNARQYEVLGEAEFLTLYRQKHQRFERLLFQLEQQPPDEAAVVTIRRVRGMGQDILRVLQAARPRSNQMAAAINQFAELAERAASIATLSDRSIDEALDQLKVNAQSAQQRMAWQVAALVPGSLILVLIFTLLIGRPIRQVESAIRNLGDGRFSKSITVKGPRRFEALGRRLDWLRLRLLELAQEKNKFLRHVSHELKTPLANIREGTELFIDGTVGRLSDNQREVASILRDNGLRLQQLIENLLTFSAWQAKEAQLELTAFALGELVQSILKTHKLTLIGHRLKVKLHVEDVPIVADRIKIRLALDNLVSNAIKFCPEGDAIYIRVTNGGREAVIDVADSGPGIPRGERDRIFEVFYQGDAAQGGHVRGTGIGLSVVRECVLAHGGSIEILDGHFKGAHFRMRLPLTQESAHA